MQQPCQAILLSEWEIDFSLAGSEKQASTLQRLWGGWHRCPQYLASLIPDCFEVLRASVIQLNRLMKKAMLYLVLLWSDFPQLWVWLLPRLTTFRFSSTNVHSSKVLLYRYLMSWRGQCCIWIMNKISSFLCLERQGIITYKIIKPCSMSAYAVLVRGSYQNCFVKSKCVICGLQCFETPVGKIAGYCLNPHMQIRSALPMFAEII